LINVSAGSHRVAPMSSALQRPIGANAVHLAGAGFVPDVGVVLADLQAEPDLLVELVPFSAVLSARTFCSFL